MLTETSPIGKSELSIDRLLERLVFGNGLVFNQTWEDPDVDRAALALSPDDVVVSIASAGDNILCLALDRPKTIHAVDVNPTQIHLLALKLCALQHLDYPDYAHLFSLAPAPRAGALYREQLRQYLDAPDRQYWDAHVGMLTGGLYRAGVYGRALGYLRTALQVRCGREALEKVFEQPTLAMQADWYARRVHAHWWNPLTRPLADRLPTLLVFGIHPNQARRVGGAHFAEFLSKAILRVFSTMPARENYFWQQVLLGRYLSLPPHLRPSNYGPLKEAAGRIHLHTGRLQTLLDSLPAGSVTCFNLLDAPDWLTEAQTLDWWRRIGRAAAPAARVLFRTIDPAYQFPSSVLAEWQDISLPTWVLRERTGAYAGVYVYRRQATAAGEGGL
jgi:S-adenosylmethionine-diacylglycerol 3-amino-3-carboxypropyl transferase